MIFQIVVPLLIMATILVAWRTHRQQLEDWRRSIRRSQNHEP